MSGRRWAQRAMILGLWTLLGLFSATQLYLYYGVVGKTVSWTQALSWTLPAWYVWAGLAPLVFRLGRRFPVERRSWRRALLVHLPASLLFALLHLILDVSIYWSLSWLKGGSFRWLASLGFNFTVYFHWHVLTYWALVSLAHALDYHRKYRDRELATSQLEAQLAQAQLQALRMQLHPHFLFNALQTIAELIHEDPLAAERTLVRLSDLLRLSLRSASAQEVSLQEELDFLERYLEIERARFQDRLTVELDVEAETLSCRVPNLILQPLVENAVRHGIAETGRAGRVRISSRRMDGMLQLKVIDNGRGLAQARAPVGGEGVGLANTRARLERLYGARQSFDLSSGSDGGLEATLLIPFACGPQEAEAGGGR